MNAQIDCAAILLSDGDILTIAKPFRHPTIILRAQMSGTSLSGSTQGFLTSEGEFVTREEAYKIARANGQLIRETKTPGTLYTEDLW